MRRHIQYRFPLIFSFVPALYLSYDGVSSPVLVWPQQAQRVHMPCCLHHRNWQITDAGILDAFEPRPSTGGMAESVKA